MIRLDAKKLFDLTGKVAVVTGGVSGLGHQMAEGMAEFGASLVIASRRVQKCEEVCREFREKFGVDAIALKLDATIEDDIINLISKTTEHYGKIDILINNVGGAIISDTVATSLKDWNHIMDLNINSAFLCCREAGKHMIEKKYGKIINIASVYGFIGSDSRNYVNTSEPREALSYSASKGAIVNFSRDLGVNWAKYGITVNAISPGGFETEATRDMLSGYCKKKFNYIIPLGRMGSDDDLKGAAIYLASDASKYVIGQNIIVDGGWSIW